MIQRHERMKQTSSLIGNPDFGTRLGKPNGATKNKAHPTELNCIVETGPEHARSNAESKDRAALLGITTAEINSNGINPLLHRAPHTQIRDLTSYRALKVSRNSSVSTINIKKTLKYSSGIFFVFTQSGLPRLSLDYT